MNKITKIILIGLLTCFSTLNVSAQQIATVKSFKQTTDHIPVNDRRKDLNNNPCALVKVQVVDDIERVEGNKIGQVLVKGVEKWIYMCKDSRNIKIHLKNHLPVTVMFKDYKINGLASNRVYELIIETPNTNNNDITQTLVLNYTPTNANVVIDSKVYQGNGRVEVKLPIGEHSYTISAYNYIPSEGKVKLNQQGPRVITENLTPEAGTQTDVIPEVVVNEGVIGGHGQDQSVVVGVNGNLFTLKVSPFYAKINIDGKAYEADEDGEITVPLSYGSHSVEVMADGYLTKKTDITLKKSSITKKIKLSKQKEEKTEKGTLMANDDKNIEVGKTGNLLTLKLKYTEDTKITLDNNLLMLNNSLDNSKKINTLLFALPFGRHEFRIARPGYESEFFNVNIGKSKVSRSVKLKKIKKGKDVVISDGSVSDGVVSGQNGNVVTFKVKPVWAKILIDGLVQNPNLDGLLSTILSYGIHKISIELDGYETQQFNINVGKNKISKMIKLKEISKKKKKK